MANLSLKSNFSAAPVLRTPRSSAPANQPQDSSKNRVTCQIYGKPNHSALTCYRRFYRGNIGNNHNVGYSSNGNGGYNQGYRSSSKPHRPPVANMVHTITHLLLLQWQILHLFHDFQTQLRIIMLPLIRNR